MGYNQEFFTDQLFHTTKPSPKNMCECTRPGCSNRRDGKVYTRDDVSCGCRFCCPCCTVLSVDGCVTSAALVYLLGWIFTLCCWEPKSASEYCYHQQAPQIVVNNHHTEYGRAVPTNQHGCTHEGHRPAY